MKRRKAKCPISDEVWAQLEERDFIKSNCTYFKLLLDCINQGLISETDETIKAYENMLEALRRAGSVSKIIDSLRDEELANEENYNTFSRRFEKLFKTSGLTLDDLAEQLGVSHSSISKSFKHSDGRSHEKPNTQIYKHYLKAYSIIFYVSPYYLIGRTDEPMKYVLSEENQKSISKLKKDRSDQCNHAFAVSAGVAEETLGYDLMRYISSSLYREPPFYFPDLFFTLPIISLFCNAKHKMRQRLKNAILSVPQIEEDMKAPICWAMETNLFDIDEELYKKHTRIIDYSLENVCEALKQLYFKDFKALKLLAVITRQRPNLKESIHNLLVYGGFTADTTAYLNKWKYGMAVCDPDRGEMLPTLLKESDIIKGIPFVLST